MAQIPDHIIDHIRNSVDIVEVVSRYLTLRKTGKNYKSLCPFHQEKTPSFTVNSDKQIFYCFGCGAGGNVFNFLMRYEKISFIEAIQKLASETGIELPKSRQDDQRTSEYERLYRANQFASDVFHDLLKKNQSTLKEYLLQRQISLESIQFFKIGFVPDSWDALYQAIVGKKLSMDSFIQTGLILVSEKDRNKRYDRFRNRLMFPVHNLSGRVVGFGGRTLSSDKETPKYVNSPESPVYVKSQILYGLYYSKEWIRQEGFVIVVEGYMDYLQLFQNNIKNVVATSGTALTEEQARIIRRYTQSVVLCYDSDTAGIQAAIRGGQILFQENLDTRVLILPAEEDPDSFVKKSGKSAFFALLNDSLDYFDFRIQQQLSSIGAESVAQKAKIVDDLIDSLAAHRDPVKQNFYASSLAQKFNLQETTLLEEIQRKTRNLRSRDRKDTEEPKRIPEKNNTLNLRGAWHAEKDVLVILINYFAEVRSVIFELLEDADFLNPEFRDIFILLRDHSDMPQENLAHWVFTNVPDQKVVGLLSADLLQEIEKPDRYLHDCILKMKVRIHQDTIDGLRQRLRKIEPHDPEISTILSEINTHLAKIHEIRTVFSNK